MKSLHLTIMIFIQVILASFFLYSNLVAAFPLNSVKPVQESAPQPILEIKPVEQSQKIAPQDASAPAVIQKESPPAPIADKIIQAIVSPAVSVPVQSPVQVPAPAPAPKGPILEPVKADETPLMAKSAPVNEIPVKVETPVIPPKVEQPIVEAPKNPIVVPAKHEEIVVAAPEVQKVVQQHPGIAPVKPVEPVVVPIPAQPVAAPLVSQPEIKQNLAIVMPISVQQPVIPVVQHENKAPVAAPAIKIEEPVPVQKEVMAQNAALAGSPVATKLVEPVNPPQVVQSIVNPPVVNGGLGPLHMLATTLCNYQPEKMVADETLNSLYCQRATLRKSLFDFMSLKFTNLEKLSSRLNPGLEIVPPKPVAPSKSGSAVAPSHGWPVVGKCTAHDLKLMSEAAWCEAEEASSLPKSPVVAVSSVASVVPVSAEELDKQVPTITSNKHMRSERARYLEQPVQVPADSSAVISKILRVADIKDAPVVESSIASLNLTQQQLATIQAQATGDVTRECKRNALRLTKALFNHLAEDQSKASDSWPKLYAQLYDDDCARKRVIDIVSALSGFRSESTSIRRDNVEFAFAMDDLRAKVLETDVAAPLTFDKQLIEVEQFLQQSVKLMLANIDPGRAKLTSMRYRSLMPGPLSADDQCIELHQRLMSKNYPTDCNPNQFGQLPDVLRMTANSLALWSVEKEISKHSLKASEYPLSSPAQPKRNVNECIANLVSG